MVLFELPKVIGEAYGTPNDAAANSLKISATIGATHEVDELLHI